MSLQLRWIPKEQTHARTTVGFDSDFACTNCRFIACFYTAEIKLETQDRGRSRVERKTEKKGETE